MNKQRVLLLTILQWLFFYSLSYATINCSAGPVTAGYGGTIHGQLLLHLNSGKAFTFNVHEQSGNNVTWNDDTQSCILDCSLSFPWKYVATNENEWFQATQSPNTSDTCTIVITQIDPPPPPLILSGNLKRVTKDNAAERRDDLRNGRDIVLSLAAAASGAAVFNPAFAVPAAVFGGQGVILNRGAEKQDAIATDPCSDISTCDYTNQANPVYPSPDDLGGYVNDDGTGIATYHNAALDEAVQVEALIGAGVESSNRSGACLFVGNSSCASDRYWESLWFLNRAGDHLWYQAWYTEQAAWLVNWYIGTDYANGLFNATDILRATAQDMDNAQ
jgi:hypothetical protein